MRKLFSGLRVYDTFYSTTRRKNVGYLGNNQMKFGHKMVVSVYGIEELEIHMLSFRLVDAFSATSIILERGRTNEKGTNNFFLKIEKE